MLKLIVLAGVAAGALAVALLKEPEEIEPSEAVPESKLERTKLKIKQRLREAQLAAQEASREKEAEVYKSYEETAHLHQDEKAP